MYLAEQGIPDIVDVERGSFQAFQAMRPGHGPLRNVPAPLCIGAEGLSRRCDTLKIT